MPLRSLRLVVTLLGILLGAACAKTPSADAPAADGAAPLRKIVVQLDWVAEPEHGGFFQAQARGWFREAGLEVELIPGGAGSVSALQMVANQRAQFGQSDSTNTILAIAEGLPLLNVAAVFQRDPTVFMLHESNPISAWPELNGKRVMARLEYAFLPYVRKKYGIDFVVQPQNFNLQQFASDPAFIQQGFYIAEPWHLMQLGVKPKWLHVWDTGFDAYTVIIANREWAAAHPEATRAFLAAYARGWRDYCEGDPTAAHAAMMQLNPNVTPAFLAWSREQIIKENLTRGDPAKGEDYVVIQRARFANQIQQLEDLEILKPRGKITVDAVMTEDYLPAR